MPRYFGKIGIAALGLLLATPVYANNLSVTNVVLGTRNPNAHTVVLSFNVSWQNSWRNKINHDAVWLTVRLNNSQITSTNSGVCQMTASGVSPSGTSTGTGSNLQIYVPQDEMGAFLEPASTGFLGNINTQNVQLTVNYQSCGFTNDDQIYANVFGLEMVFIPQGSFYAGDYGASTASLVSGSTDTTPWYISSENPIPVTNAASGAYYYVSGGNGGEFPSGSQFTVPATFPKGYNAFYVMKYEINEGQWVQFMNSVPAAWRLNRDLSDNHHKNTTNVAYRNTISCSGSPLVCSTQRPARALGFLSWMDLAAFLDWAALRPMTELEFEKMSRGPLVPFAGEYVWGNQTVTAASIISGTSEDGKEAITGSGNANYNSSTLSGGDTSIGPEYIQGPLRGGIFAGANATRTSSGASFYGVMDLGGNLKERVVTIGNSVGLTFTGSEGTGLLNSTSGYEGNANVPGWPGMDANPQNGVVGAAGSGFRGGSWNDSANYLRTSDRIEAALTSTDALNTFGGRGVRTYDGN
ncbi:MAG: SUMF1/EgtB/PvdO family nonheme iron enzyme [Candidatus Omnitrophica bacterium]|nr:SUMF1/EgtB/PvdO family nonheme iron enzyme [Candidatus Omnitrophota bacterium]